jgi:hypothetical protein
LGREQYTANKIVSDDVNEGRNDDLLVLSHIFSLPELHYIDIATQQKIPQILQRWPLLAELAHLYTPKSAKEV